MIYTDQQLKLALAKMLPEQIVIIPPNTGTIFNTAALVCWRCKKQLGCDYGDEVLDTELLHLCWLVEDKLNQAEFASYHENLTDYRLSQFSQRRLHVTASWQQRTIALARVKGISL